MMGRLITWSLDTIRSKVEKVLWDALSSIPLRVNLEKVRKTEDNLLLVEGSFRTVGGSLRRFKMKFDDASLMLVDYEVE